MVAIILLITAVVVFLLRSAGVTHARFELTAFGLACFAASFLAGGAHLP